MKKKIKKAVIMIFAVMVVFGTVHFMRELNDRKIMDQIDESLYLANIRIITKVSEHSENVSNTSYDLGSSGTLFKKEGDIYYALTAYHVVEQEADIHDFELIVLTENDFSFNEYLKNGGVYQGFEAYYQNFPVARVEVVDPENDLAILSFESEQDLRVLDIAENPVSRGETIITISNYEGAHGFVSIGKVLSEKEDSVYYEDIDKTYPILQHTASLSFGSSGSALLNEEHEIAGINIGGQGAKLLGIDLAVFKISYAVPLSYVVSLIETLCVSE